MTRTEFIAWALREANKARMHAFATNDPIGHAYANLLMKMVVS